MIPPCGARWLARPALPARGQRRQRGCRARRLEATATQSGYPRSRPVRWDRSSTPRSICPAPRSKSGAGRRCRTKVRSRDLAGTRAICPRRWTVRAIRRRCSACAHAGAADARRPERHAAGVAYAPASCSSARAAGTVSSACSKCATPRAIPEAARPHAGNVAFLDLKSASERLVAAQRSRSFSASSLPGCC